MDPLTQAKQMAAYNNSLSMSNARAQWAFNAQEAAKNRDWQERLSNSAHQREIADLKKAGLNPALSITNGNGATTASGASATGEAADVDTSLTRGIIDMANAQLNSATILQKTAMETNAAMSRLTYEESQKNKRHRIPSGNSTVGQIAGIPEALKYGLTSAFDVLHNLDSFFVKNSLKSDYKNSNQKYTTDIDKMISGLKQGKTGKELSEYSRIKNYYYSPKKGTGHRTVRQHRRFK